MSGRTVATPRDSNATMPTDRITPRLSARYGPEKTLSVRFGCALPGSFAGPSRSSGNSSTCVDMRSPRVRKLLSDAEQNRKGTGAMVNTPQGTEGAASLTAQRTRGRPRDERIDIAVRNAVLEILNEVGYGRLTLEAVAACAGTSKPTLRRRWRSRQHLVVSALVQTMGSSPTPDTGC